MMHGRIMRRSMTLLGAIVIMVAGTVSAVAQAPELEAGVGFGGRVEVVEAGYALTLPDDWLTLRPTSGDIDVIVEEVGLIAPELLPAIEPLLRGGLSFSLLTFSSDVDPEFAENCNVIVRPSDGSSIDDIAAREISQMAGFGDLIATGPSLSFVPLPAGRAARIDLGLDLPDFTTASTAYLFTDGDSQFTLTCTDLQRPSDAWLSVAQGFELLTPAVVTG